MALREVRKIPAKDKSLASYVRRLQSEGKIKSYISEAGYISYDTEELARYKKTVRVGRYPKNDNYLTKSDYEAIKSGFDAEGNE